MNDRERERQRILDEVFEQAVRRKKSDAPRPAEAAAPKPRPLQPARPPKPQPEPLEPAPPSPPKPQNPPPPVRPRPLPNPKAVAVLEREEPAEPPDLPADEPEEDVKVYVPKSETAGYTDERTRIVDIASASEPPASPPPGPADDDELEQISLDSLFGDSLPTGEKPPAIIDISSHSTRLPGSKIKDPPGREPAGDGEPSPEELAEKRLQEERRRRAEEFRPAFKLAGEEELNDPDEEPDRFEDGELEDYGGYEDTEAVRGELAYRRRMGWIQLLLTGAAAILLVLATVGATVLELPFLPAGVYVGVSAFLLFVSLLVNYATVSDGAVDLIRRRPGAESGVALMAVFALLQTLVQLFNLKAVAGGDSVLLAPAAGIGLFLAAAGQQITILRVSRNFAFVSHPGVKYAARIVDDPRAAREIGAGSVAVGDPLVAYYRRTDFLSYFLENSYAPYGSPGTMRNYVFAAAAGSAVLAAVYGIYGGNWWNALTVLGAALCLSMPAGLLMTAGAPYLRAATRLLRRGGMLVGQPAADAFGEADALAVDALELFPSESVRLHGIKTFSGARIDEAILDAAAVSIAAGGPLSSVFRRVIADRVDILGEVDTLVYEQDMGMSGWVGGRRVLIGNRRLLANHGIDVPSSDYEQRYARDGRQLVYLSTAGELCAMFVISYLADEGIAQALELLTGAGVTLLVRTCDPNVTEDLVCDTFGLDPYYVEVMNAPAGRRYEMLAHTGRAEGGVVPAPAQDEAVLAANGRLEGMATGLALCRRLRKAARLAVGVQVTGGVLGFVLVALVSLLAAGAPHSPLLMTLYMALWSLVSLLAPTFKGV